MQQPTIYLTIGLIGTGKSTWAKKFASVSPSLIISKDSLREMYFGKYGFNEHVETLIHKATDELISLAISEIIMGLDNYQNIILDDCHLTKLERSAYVSLIRSTEESCHRPNFFKISYLYFVDTEGDGLSRRCNEHRNLGEDHWLNVYEWQVNRIEIPTYEEIDYNNIDSFLTMNTF